MKKVTAAVIQRDGKILIAQRGGSVPLGGKWEFPGGKMEPGETPEECLARELFEEFGITAEIGEFLCRSTNDDPSRPIELLAYWVSHTEGDFIMRDHQRIAWVSPGELKDYEYPYADLAVVERLTGEPHA